MVNKLNYFSLVMPVYNDEKNVGDAIKSIINQSYKNWELIIVDDGSVDDSYKIAKRYASKNKKIKAYKMDKNWGAPFCMNFGTKQAKYNWVGIVDSDAKEPEGWLKIANDISKKDIDVFGGRVNYTKIKNSTYLQNIFYYIETGLFSNEERLYNLGNLKEPAIAGANFFYTKEVFNKLNKFNTNIRAGYDRLFICQAIEKGFDVLYTPKLVIFHPLYNWKSLIDFLERTILFTKWKNIRFQYSKLLEKPYLIVPRLLFLLSITIILSSFIIGIKNTVLAGILSLILLFFYHFLKLKNKIPLRYIPGYILVDFIKKSISSTIYLFKLKPKTNYWKKNETQSK